MSGETFSINGEPLTKFKVSQLGKSALVVPVKAQDEVIGLLVVVREKKTPFDPGNQFMLEAVADYVSVSLVNARLFRALAKQARTLQNSAGTTTEKTIRLSGEIVDEVNKIFQIPYSEVEQQIDFLLNGNSEGITDDKQDVLNKLQSNLVDIKNLVETLSQFEKVTS